jgi:hypothetical protein
MRKFLLITLITFLTHFQNWAQSVDSLVIKRGCGSVEHNQYLEQTHPEFKARKDQFEYLLQKQLIQNRLARKAASNEVITIPVVVHVIHNNSSNKIGGPGNNNISDEQIRSQIDVLNEDYRKKAGTLGDNNNPVGVDTKIEFCLASTDPNCKPTTGITRHYSSRTGFDMNYDNQMIKSFVYWPSDQYLNIWVCTLNDGVLGYAQFPNFTGLPGLPIYDQGPLTDGIVIHHAAFGRLTGTSNSGKFKLGRTTTHEVGHWLGLKHIWGECAGCSTCDTDYCEDTPPQNRDSPADESCPARISNCSGTIYDNMAENYMDYSADKCMNIFTKDQNDRMQTTLSVSPNRLALLNSKGCQITKIIPFPVSVDFDDQLPNDWLITSSDTFPKWENKSPGATGSSNATACNNQLASKTSLLSNFDSPYIDFSEANAPALIFDLAYPNTGTITDTLILAYAENCSLNAYTAFETLTGSALITCQSPATNFSPATTDWKTYIYKLPFLKNSPQAKIRFSSLSAKSGSIYLDNINIIDIKNNCYVTPSGILKFDKISLENGESASIKIYDFTGKLIESLTVNAGIDIFSYNLQHLASGMYIAALETNSTNSKTKFVLTH